MSQPVRIDRLLVARNFCDSRARAQALIGRGAVVVFGRRVRKPSELFDPDVPIEVTEALPFVSRGGEKLEGALEIFGLDVTGSSALDVGASTGGFTDCLLERGAARVVAVDVGTGQLHASLRADPRVTSMEQTDVRDLTRSALPFLPDLVVVDASFIRLGVLAEPLAHLTPKGATLLALVKPQFEVGPDVARRSKGVIKDAAARTRGIDEARRALSEAGFDVLREADSVVSGSDGNVERFVLGRRR